MKKSHVRIMALNLLMTAGSLMIAQAEPSDLYYKCFGMDPCTSHCNSATNAQEDYDSLDAAISAVEPYMTAYVDGNYVENDFEPGHLYDAYYGLPYYEFVSVFMHGCPGHLDFPNQGVQVPHADMEFGGGYDDYHMWLWAHSCEWFKVPYFHGDTRNPVFATCGESMWWDNTSGTEGGVVISDGIDEFTLTGLDDDDWLKVRLSKELNSQGNFDFDLSWFDTISIEMLEVKNTGQVKIYLGSMSDTVITQRITSGRTYLGTITFGSLGYVKERMPVSIAENTLVGDRCLYFEWTNISGGTDLGDMWYANLHWNPTKRDTVRCHYNRDGISDSVQVRTNDWGKSFEGLHAIMGWASVTYHSRDKHIYRPFFRRWVEYGGYLGYSFLYAVQDEFGSPRETCLPTIAYDFGEIKPQWNDDFFWEEWSESPGNQNTNGDCETWYSFPDDLIWD